MLCLLMPIGVALGSKHFGNTTHPWAIAHLHRTILLLNVHFLLRATAYLKAIMILMHSCHELQPLFWKFSCFISPPQELKWIVFHGEAYFCWLSISGGGGFYGAILSISKPFLNHPFSQQLYCPEIALCINTNHAYVVHGSQSRKLPFTYTV